jgi:hypothetical protein
MAHGCLAPDHCRSSPFLLFCCSPSYLSCILSCGVGSDFVWSRLSHLDVVELVTNECFAYGSVSELTVSFNVRVSKVPAPARARSAAPSWHVTIDAEFDTKEVPPPLSFITWFAVLWCHHTVCACSLLPATTGMRLLLQQTERHDNRGVWARRTALGQDSGQRVGGGGAGPMGKRVLPVHSVHRR